ncbi:hypothetical protein K435DRAFT_494371 [Dendrothele bispora CBS 962.96]|uniref:Uncharacterized protein n=1 Tax=Dendrothele bispora (strain CBS 962.96) TaxID=1314807 RepID=A0A4S8KXD7_DENBC|nr:hypothetical protein K435DRAFT_494371 [Dendrothele bispora CBS 962.96]
MVRFTGHVEGMRACMPTPVSTFLHELSCLDVVVKRELDLNFIVLIDRFLERVSCRSCSQHLASCLNNSDLLKHRLPGIRKMLLRSCPYTIR